MNKKLLILLPLLLLCSCSKQEEPDKPIEYKNLDVITYQPFYFQSSTITSKEEMPLPEGINSYGDLIVDAGKILSNASDKITYKENLSTKDKSLGHDEFSKMGKNQVILFEGHGSCIWMDNEPRSVIWTGNDYDETKKETDFDYKENLLVEADYNEAFTSYYVEKYCPDISGSIVYLDNCFSARDSTLAKSFLDKGAAAVIGHTNTTQQIYGNTILHETIKNLTVINKQTKTTYTLYEALTLAKEKYGKDDGVKFPYALNSEPLLFGDPNWKISL